MQLIIRFGALLCFLFFASRLPAQQITFTYQSGLTSPVIRIIPIPASNTCLIAERNGNFLAWDISMNRILCRIAGPDEQIADIVYCEKDRKILLASASGITAFNAAKLLTEHTLDQEFHLSLPGAAALHWNEKEKILHAITQNGTVNSFTTIAGIRANKRTTTFKSGISMPVAIRPIGDRLCIIGVQRQGFFSRTGKPLFSGNNYCTGMYGYAFNETDSSVYLPREAGVIKLSYTKNKFTTKIYELGNRENGDLALGLTVNPVTREVFAGTNRDKIYSLDPRGTSASPVFQSPDGSFTALLTHGDKLFAGDFFGNVIVLDYTSKTKRFQLNEDATPSLNGVYLDAKNRMISTHFGLRGSALKIWEIPTATLVKSFNLRSNIAYDVLFDETGDSIYSAHTDEAVYRYYQKDGQYIVDTIAAPDNTFMYGSIFFDLEKDRKSVREKTIKSFTGMLNLPGIHVFPADSLNSTEIVFVNTLDVPKECTEGKLPSNYRISEAYIAATGLVKESSSWDLLEKDLFYMRACSSPTQDIFLSRVADHGIDTVKTIRYYNAVKGREKFPPFFYMNSTAEGRTIFSSSITQKPLFADISRMPVQALFFYPDTVVAWNGKTQTATIAHTGKADMDFYYDASDNYIAIADNKAGNITLVPLSVTVNTGSTKWISFGEEDYLVYNEQGFYKVLGRSNRINFAIDGKPLSFNSFDLRYNRPDLVMKDIGAADSALIAAYASASRKRVQRSGLKIPAITGTDMPEVIIVNRDSIPYNQAAGELGVHLKAGSATPIDRFNIRVNESPLYGSNGHRYNAAGAKNLDTTITVRLLPGENKIEVSVVTAEGVESDRMPLSVNFMPDTTMPETLYFTGIGIDRFHDATYNLRYSVKDIRDLSARLREKYGNNIVIDTLFNEQVNIDNIRSLKSRLLRTGINDKVIIAYSGHGLLSSTYDYYLSTFNVNFTNPAVNGLPYSEFEFLLDSIPARKKLMLIDACHSGELDKEDLLTINASPDFLIKGLKPVRYKNEQGLGLKNSFELMQDLFINVGKSTGATIISAAAGTQFALERNDLKNGVFTYAILEAMNRHASLKVSELRRIVGERVVQITNGLQKPTSRSETVGVEWRVW